MGPAEEQRLLAALETIARELGQIREALGKGFGFVGQRYELGANGVTLVLQQIDKHLQKLSKPR